MRLKNSKEIKAFKEAIAKCKGDVWLETPMGDRYNLKSLLTQYIAVAALLGEHGDELELFCSNRADEAKFVKFLQQHQEVI